MLKSLTLHNWKSFGTSRNRLQFGGLTLLVGPNASGKSNALDALRFLQGSALDFPLGDVLRGRWEGQREIWPPIRGQVVEAARGSEAVFALESDWRVCVDGHYWKCHHKLRVDTSGEVLVGSESAGYGMSTPVFDTEAPTMGASGGPPPGGSIKVALRAKGSGKSEVRSCFATRSLLGQISDGGRVDPQGIRQIRALQSKLREVVFLDVQPARMREYKPENIPSLGTSAENISSKLSGLSDEQLASILEWVGELCAPELESIEFDRTQLREVMFFLQEKRGGRISARSVSDGTLRFLGLVTALTTAEKGSIIVLEEPDVGLHPARIHLLARLLETTTAERKIQVIATTHSPILLAHLGPAALADVVAMDRGPDGATVCSRIGDLEHFSTVRDSKQLDHLISTGWIERAL